MKKILILSFVLIISLSVFSNITLSYPLRFDYNLENVTLYNYSNYYLLIKEKQTNIKVGLLFENEVKNKISISENAFENLNHPKDTLVYGIKSSINQILLGDKRFDNYYLDLGIGMENAFLERENFSIFNSYHNLSTKLEFSAKDNSVFYLKNINFVAEAKKGLYWENEEINFYSNFNVDLNFNYSLYNHILLKNNFKLGLTNNSNSLPNYFKDPYFMRGSYSSYSENVNVFNSSEISLYFQNRNLFHNLFEIGVFNDLYYGNDEYSLNKSNFAGITGVFLRYSAKTFLSGRTSVEAGIGKNYKIKESFSESFEDKYIPYISFKADFNFISAIFAALFFF
jgi:hypothetical protein